MNPSRSLNRTSVTHLRLAGFDDPEPSPLNSHFVIDPDEEEAAHPQFLAFSSEEEREDHAHHYHSSAFSSDADNDNDTASQRSISLSSPPQSPLSPSHHHDTSYDHLSIPAIATPTSTSTLSPNSATHLMPGVEDGIAPPPIPITPVTFIRQNLANAKRDSTAYTLDTDMSSEVDDDRSSFMKRLDRDDESVSSVALSLASVKAPVAKENVPPSIDTKPILPSHSQSILTPQAQSQPSPFPSVPQSSSTTTYPPPPIGTSLLQHDLDRDSMASFGSGSTSYSKKARPESLLVQVPVGSLILGIALVDFNHLVGPKIEFSRGIVFEDEGVAGILPFLALPDGAHLSTEDYSYFHLVPSSSPKPSTLFGISCNRQIKATELTKKHPDVTRSTVQKAVVVLASKPVFGPIRDRLGVVTRALFDQKDFSDLSILDAFYESLQGNLKSQLTESGFYMGTSLRELVHTFRHRTLILLKALMLQKRIMFYGHPVERLCTYQYSLISLIPGLLQNLDDSGSPPLASRAQGLTRPTSLKTSDRKSMMAYSGLPLDLFGKDAFFQPYLPLQQIDILKDTKSWLCGCTNSIVSQQKEVDLLINTETGSFEFRDHQLERSAGLTAADRKWMEEVVRDVNEGWNDDDEETPTSTLQFKGSDDYLRSKFDEYITGALASVKYADFMTKGQGSGVMITDGAGDPNAVQDFNMLWISEFKKTNAYEVWDRVTDPMLFDIVEPRHPCSERPSVVADISLRLSEGIQELKLEQQLAPTREAISRTLTAGSTNFFKAVEGVKGRWLQRNASSSSNLSAGSSGGDPSSLSNSTVDVSKVDIPAVASPSSRQNSLDIPRPNLGTPPPPPPPHSTPVQRSSTSSISSTPFPSPRPPSTFSVNMSPEPVKTTLTSWGAGIGSFFSQRSARFPSFSAGRPSSVLSSNSNSNSKEAEDPSSGNTSPVASPPMLHVEAVKEDGDLGLDEIQPRDLDKEYGAIEGSIH